MAKRSTAALVVAVLMLAAGSWAAGPAIAAASNTTSFSVTVESDGTCDFAFSFTWNGYGGGDNDALTFRLHNRYTDGSGVHDMVVQSQPFAHVSGHDGTQPWTFVTFSGPGGPVPVIVSGDWFGEALLASKSNGQGAARTLADVDSTVITRPCRAG